MPTRSLIEHLLHLFSCGCSNLIIRQQSSPYFIFSIPNDVDLQIPSNISGDAPGGGLRDESSCVGGSEDESTWKTIGARFDLNFDTVQLSSSEEGFMKTKGEHLCIQKM